MLPLQAVDADHWRRRRPQQQPPQPQQPQPQPQPKAQAGDRSLLLLDSRVEGLGNGSADGSCEGLDGGRGDGASAPRDAVALVPGGLLLAATPAGKLALKFCVGNVPMNFFFIWPLEVLSRCSAV